MEDKYDDDDEDIYNEEFSENLLEDDEINSNERGFMEGYMWEGKRSKTKC